MADRDEIGATAERVAGEHHGHCPAATGRYGALLMRSDCDCGRAQRVAEIEAALRDRAEAIEALRRLIRGQRHGASSDITELASYGYGDLDLNGFWEYPLQEADVLAFQATIRAERKAGVVEGIRMAEEVLARRIETLLAWRLEAQNDQALVLKLALTEMRALADEKEK